MVRSLSSRDAGVLSLLLVVGLSMPALAQLPNGVASGDTTANSTVLWARGGATGNLQFEVSTTADFSNIVQSGGVNVADVMVPAKLGVNGLSAGTRYYYRATDGSGAQQAGTFKTAASGNRNGVRFGVSGDWRGDVAPFPAVKNVPGRNLDLFVALGDTVYADVTSPAIPGSQAQTLAEFRAKHNEVYSSRGGLNGLGDLRASTSILATIDDHEVTNDFQGFDTVSNDPRFTFGGAQPGDRLNRTPLYANGLQTFHEYNPIESRTYANTGTDARMDGLPELYRRRDYGNDATIIVTDQRSFRDRGLTPVADPTNGAQIGGYLAASFTPGRTLLGQRQVDQLKSDLLDAQGRGQLWKFVNLSEPIQNLGVLGASDRYEGYAAERAEILGFVRDNNIENVVFVSADIHGTLVNNLTYQNGPFQPQIQSGAWEISTGSVGFDAPFGPTVAAIAAGLGLPGSLQLADYLALPNVQQEAYVRGLVNAQIQPLGYDPIGLEGSPINAQLLVGGYSATNSYGWTEFDIAPGTGLLTVTTYGIPFYSADFAAANPDFVASLTPSIVSQFVVTPVPSAGGAGLLALAGLVATRRRR